MKLSETKLEALASNVDLYVDLVPHGRRVLFAGPTSRKAPRPKKGTYPRGLKDRARPIWDELVETYAEPLKDIEKAHNTDWSYAAAVIILRKLCVREQLGSPFDVMRRRKDSSVAYRRTAGDLYRRYFKALGYVGKIRKALVKHKVIQEEKSSNAGPFFMMTQSPKAKTYALEFYYEFDPVGGGPVSDADFVSAAQKVLTSKVSSALRFKKVGGTLTKGFDVKVGNRKIELIRIRFGSDGLLVVSFRITEAEAIGLFGMAGRTKNGALDALAELGRKNNGDVTRTIEQEFGEYAAQRGRRA